MEVLERKKSMLFVCIGTLLAAAPLPGQTVQPIPAISTEDALPGIRVSWYTGLDKKMLMMRVENVSGKNINAYNVSIGLKYADGSTDYGQGFFPSAHMEMFQVIPMNGMEPHNLAAGTADRDQPIGGGVADKEVVEIVAVPDVIVYADDTAEVRNEFFFKQIMASRKGALLAWQQVSETIKHVLADGVQNPTDAAIEELTRVEIALRNKHSPPEEPENNEEQALRSEINQVENAGRMATNMKMTEREYLAKMADDLDKQIALMAPHCDVKRIDQ